MKTRKSKKTAAKVKSKTKRTPSHITAGQKIIGHDHSIFLIAEIGINHNGDLNIAKKLIDAACDAGADAVKFQKRTVDVVYTPEELARPRENPFGPTNGHLKRGLEFDYDGYKEIDDYCKTKGIVWFASCWDEDSVDFMEQFNPPLYKIASACMTDEGLLRYTRSKGRPIILSTGMADLDMVRRAVEILGENDLVLMHTISTYPADHRHLNLRVINTLRDEFGLPVGYSGHEVGVSPSLAAAVLGACAIERHVTLDRAMWGSDQASSVEPYGLKKLFTYIRQWEESRGDGIKRIHELEKPIIAKLRRKHFST